MLCGNTEILVQRDLGAPPTVAGLQAGEKFSQVWRPTGLEPSESVRCYVRVRSRRYSVVLHYLGGTGSRNPAGTQILGCSSSLYKIA